MREVVALLVRGEYEALELRTGGANLSAADLQNVVADYPRKLSLPPPDRVPALEVVEIIVAPKPAWSVAVPLWDLGEGLSDLTLELTVHEEFPGSYAIEIDGLHVL